MPLQHCRAAAPALPRPRPHDIAALRHAVRSFHISARRSDESSGSGSSSNNQPATLNSARARSQVASQRIQSLNPANKNATGQYKQVGLAGGSFRSGQNVPQGRVLTPVRRGDSNAPTTGGPRLQTPRLQTRVNDRPGAPRFPGAGGGARRPGGFGNRGPGGARAGGGGRPGSGPARRRGRAGGRRGERKADGEQGGQVQLSNTVLQYLLSLKAARRAVKTYTPAEPTKEALISQSALSASLGQPGGAAALLEQRLRSLAERAEMDQPVPLLAQARRLVRGQFVKFADDRERDAVLDLVAQHQAEIAARLSEKKGEEIAPKPIEFEELGGDVRQKTTDAVVAGRYVVHARATEPPEEGIATPQSSRDVAARMLDLNGSYVGDVREKFLNRFNAVMGVQDAAASHGKQQKANA